MDGFKMSMGMGMGSGIGGNPFISEWDTRNTSTGSSTDTQIQLPLVAGGTYDFWVYWGDGTSSHITSWNQAETLHDYGVGNGGVKTIRIVGTIIGFKFAYSGDVLKLLSIRLLGNLAFLDSGFWFAGCSNFVGSYDPFKIVGKTSFEYMFANCYVFNQPVASLDTSAGAYFDYMFFSCYVFDQPVASLDTSAAENFAYMFFGCFVFDQSLASFVIANVTSMLHFLTDVTLSVANFSATIISWQTQSHHQNISTDFGNSKLVMGSVADDALISLNVDDGWTILFGGYV